MKLSEIFIRVPARLEPQRSNSVTPTVVDEYKGELETNCWPGDCWTVGLISCDFQSCFREVETVGEQTFWNVPDRVDPLDSLVGIDF